MINTALVSLIGRKFPLFSACLVATTSTAGIVYSIVNFDKEAILIVIFMALCFVASVQRIIKITRVAKKSDA